MKFLDLININNSIKKFGKGMLAIVTIKLLLIVGVFVIQSCGTNELETGAIDHEAIAFQKTLNEFALNMEELLENGVEKSNLMASKEVWHCNLFNINGQEVNFCFSESHITQMKQNMQQTINSAKDFLYSRGLNDNDINEILEGSDDSSLIPLVESVLYVEAEASGYVLNKRKSSENLELFGIYSAMAQEVHFDSGPGFDWGMIGGCAAAAIGLDSLGTLRDALAGKKVTGKALKKAAKKVVKKFVAGATGWGTILIVAEFSICVGLNSL